MSDLNQAIESLGELFLMGFEGTELGDDTAQFISQNRIGGVILFAKNYSSLDQLIRLNNQIQENRGTLPLWIAVDHEGGRVQRFKEPFSIIPEARSLVNVSSPRYLFEVGEVIAKELGSTGININFTPVADINTNPDNPIIGNRAFGTTEDVVTNAVTAICRGHITQGVQACVKHFPGHGDTNVDSHLDLPTVNTPLEVLRDREFKPFTKAFKSRCNMVMTAHILNPNIDPDWPATLSKKTLRGILRDELRYTKIIFSDDMEMEAITKHYGAKEAPRLALEAGCDILIYRSEGAARKAYTSLTDDLESGRLDPKIVLDAAKRSKDVKKSALKDYKPATLENAEKTVGCQEHQDLINKAK